MLLVSQARCTECRCRCANVSISEHGLCCVCESRADERHCKRVFAKRGVLMKSLMIAEADIMVNTAVRKLKEARRGVHAA